MLAREKLDIVSICTWPNLHEEMVVAAAEAGVKAAFTAKSRWPTRGKAQNMVETCEALGVKLAFNHQRRYGAPFFKAKALLDAGEIGELKEVSFGFGNLYDYGSHSFDLCNYFNDERPARWIICQIDYRKESLVFGAAQRKPGLCFVAVRQRRLWGRFDGRGRGSHQLPPSPGRRPRRDRDRSLGEGLPVLRIRRSGQADWEAIDCGGEDCHGPGYIERAIADFVAAASRERIRSFAAATH